MRPARPSCAEPDCGRPAVGRGLCPRHYKQWQRHGRTLPESEPAACAVPACERRAVTRGWCHGHYLRWHRGGDVRADVALQRDVADRCTVDGCERGARSKGLCQSHYSRWRAHGDVQPDVPLRIVNGAGSLTHGYWKVAVPPDQRHLSAGERSIGEHRLVMATILGRALRGDETVHHINGDRLDNRPENLELWSCAQPAGQRVHDKVAFAVEILQRYRPELLQ